MGWSVGYDDKWQRWIGYGVPAYCDHPGCMKEIDRGLGYVCGGDAYGGERGCGLFFCGEHLFYSPRLTMQLCASCLPRRHAPFYKTPDHPKWIKHILTDKSWAKWRKENPGEVARLRAA